MIQNSMPLPSGFTFDTSPDYQDAICIFGLPNSGTTRFGTTMPHDEGRIAFLCLDMNSKHTVDRLKKIHPELDKRIVVNKEPYLADQAAVNLITRMSVTSNMSKTDEVARAKEVAGTAAREDFMRVCDKVRKDLVALTESPGIQSVVIDKNSLLFNWILFSRHGRAQQIEQLSRAVPNQDMVDIINMVRQKKHLLLIHRASEVYVKTGEKDSQGRDKTKSTGTYKPEAMGNIEGFVTATIELKSKKSLGVQGQRKPGEDLEDWQWRVNKLKYEVLVHRCKDNTLIEGLSLSSLPQELESRLTMELEDYRGPGVSGEDITWESVMSVLKTGVPDRLGEGDDD